MSELRRHASRLIWWTLALPAVLAQGAAAADDTFACLDAFSGPLVQIAGEHGPFERLTWLPETRYDARGASWHAFLDTSRGFDRIKTCYAIELGDDWRGCYRQELDRFDLWDDAANPRQPAPPVCWAGGLVQGTQSRELGWREVKLSQGMAITLNSEHGIVDGVRIHNHQDAIVPLVSKRFEVRNSWISNNRDDVIENDGFASGLIEDNLIEDAFVFLSMRNTKPPNPPVAAGPDGLVEIRGNVVSLGPRGEAGNLVGQPGHLFKIKDAHTPALALHGNLFLFPDMETSGVDPSPARIDTCSNNLIVYEGEKPQVPRIDCFTFTPDRAMFERARKNWIDCHPHLMRLPNDPMPEPAACDPGFWGGGGSG